MGYCDLPLSRLNLGQLQEERREEGDWIVLEELIALPDASKHRRSCWCALDAYCMATYLHTLTAIRAGDPLSHRLALAALNLLTFLPVGSS
jgi:hypothetical protein